MHRIKDLCVLIPDLSHWVARHDVSNPMQNSVRNSASSLCAPENMDPNRVQHLLELDSGTSANGAPMISSFSRNLLIVPLVSSGVGLSSGQRRTARRADNGRPRAMYRHGQ